MTLIWSVLGLLYLAAMFTLIRIFTKNGGFWAGYYNITAMKTIICSTCDGYGQLWLKPEGSGVQLVKVPYRHRNLQAANDKPQLANLVDCDDCGGTGQVVTSGGPERFLRLPFPWPWRHWHL
jgi:hypothetical protein